MAVLDCWKSGHLAVAPKKMLPEGALVLLYGPHQHLQSELIATTRREEDGTRYVPGMALLPEDTPEDARFIIVQAYIKLLARRIAQRTKAGRERWARMEAAEQSLQA
jgi:hypothetical protein